MFETTNLGALLMFAGIAIFSYIILTLYDCVKSFLVKILKSN